MHALDFGKDATPAIIFGVRMQKNWLAALQANARPLARSGQLGGGELMQLGPSCIQGVEQRARCLLRLGALGHGEGSLDQVPCKREGGAGGAGQCDAAALHELIAAGEDGGPER